MKTNSNLSADSRLKLNFAKSVAKFKYDPIVKISELDNKDLLVLLSGDGGNLLIFSELVRHFPSLDIVGLIPKGWSGQDHPATSIKEYIDLFYPELRKLAQGKQVHFIGWCFGGILAIELATKLKDDRMKVGSVSIVESMGPMPANSVQRTRGHWVSKKIHEIGTVGWKLFLKSKLKARARTVRHDFRRFACKLYLATRRPIPFEWREKFIQRYDAEMERSYRGTNYQGDISLFWSKNDPGWEWLKSPMNSRVFQGESALDNWSKCISGNVGFVEVPGDHISMFKNPNVEHLAFELLNNINCFIASNSKNKI